MIQDLKVSMPLDEKCRKIMDEWKKAASENKAAIGEPFYFCSFRGYQSVFRQFRKEKKDGFCLFQVRFEPRDENSRQPNLVSAREFLLTLVEKQIPVAASFPNSEFEQNLCDLVVQKI